MIPEYKVTEGVPRSKCPACLRFVNEGSKHRCPNNRHRNPFVNPKYDKEPWNQGDSKK